MYVFETCTNRNHFYTDSHSPTDTLFIAHLLNETGLNFTVWTVSDPPAQLIPSDFGLNNTDFLGWRF